MLDLLQAIQEQRALPATIQAEIEQTRQQIATLRWQLVTQADPALPTPLQAQGNAQIAGLEQQLLDLRRLRNHLPHPPSTLGTLAESTNPATILANLTTDLLIEYVRCGDELWGVVADRHGRCEGMRLAEVETIADLNARLQLRFGNVVAQPAARRCQWNERWLAECLPLLHRCYQLLLAPLVAILDSIIK